LPKRKCLLAFARVLLVAALFCGVALGTIWFFFQDVIEERWAVLSLRRLGYQVGLSGSIFGEPEPGLGPVRCLGVGGDRPLDADAMALVARFKNLRILVLGCESIEPGALERFGSLGEFLWLEFLGISGTHVDDRALQGLGKVYVLDRLSILGTAIQGPALAEVSSIAPVRELWLTDNANLGDFRSVNLRHLNEVVLVDLTRSRIVGDCLGWLPNCRRLCLDGTAAGDDTLRGLSHCTRLERLSLMNTCVTGKGLKHLASLPLLNHLDLTCCPISDESLDSVQSLKRLKALRLGGATISDNGLDRLCKATQLRYVDVSGCARISEAAVARLRRSLASAAEKDAEEPEAEVHAIPLLGGGSGQVQLTSRRAERNATASHSYSSTESSGTSSSSDHHSYSGSDDDSWTVTDYGSSRRSGTPRA